GMASVQQEALEPSHGIHDLATAQTPDQADVAELLHNHSLMLAEKIRASVQELARCRSGSLKHGECFNYPQPVGFWQISRYRLRCGSAIGSVHGASAHGAAAARQAPA